MSVGWTNQVRAITEYWAIHATLFCSTQVTCYIIELVLLQPTFFLKKGGGVNYLLQYFRKILMRPSSFTVFPQMFI